MKDDNETITFIGVWTTENSGNKGSPHQAEGDNTEKSTFDFEKKSWSTDFVLNVEGTKLYVAKNILALASPVFFRMFQSDFKESSSEELALPGKKVEAVKQFLRCIYPNTLWQITADNVLKLVPLFEEYQVLHLKERCEKILMERVGTATSTEELFQGLKESAMYNLMDYRRKCIELASIKTQQELEGVKMVCKPPAEDLAEILNNITTNMSKEQDVFWSYFNAEIKNSKELQFDSSTKWKGRHIVVQIPIENRYISSTQIEIWGVPFKVSTSTVTSKPQNVIGHISLYSRRIDKRILRIRVVSEEEEKRFSCKLNMRCDLVNRQSTKSNRSVCFKNDFYGNVAQDTYDITEIESDDSGFVRNGKIALIIHIYMSKPSWE